jgi:opacity protein-like surface antigen
MKQSIVLTFLIFISTYCFAQKDTLTGKPTLRPDTSLKIHTTSVDSIIPIDTSKKVTKKDFISIELHVGLSKPIGNYNNDYFANPLAGYAREGMSIGLNFSLRVKENIDFLVSYSRQTNDFKEAEFSKNALAKKPNYVVKVNENWRNNFILIGGSYVFKLGEDNYFTPRFLFGLCVSKTPEYVFEPSSAKATSVSETIASDTEARFAFKLGFGLKKNLNENFTLSLNPDFFYSSTGRNINKPYFDNLNTAQSISTISFCFGIGYRIGK